MRLEAVSFTWKDNDDYTYMIEMNTYGPEYSVGYVMKNRSNKVITKYDLMVNKSSLFSVFKDAIDEEYYDRPNFEEFEFEKITYTKYAPSEPSRYTWRKTYSEDMICPTKDYLFGKIDDIEHLMYNKPIDELEACASVIRSINHNNIGNHLALD